MTDLVAAVADDQLDAPTPCDDTSVARLLDHLVGLSLAFTWAAHKTTPADAGPPRSAAEHLDPDWRSVLPKQLDELAAAWRDPKAWEGMAVAGGITMPSEVMGLVALDELTLHGWDLAMAIGQAFPCDPTSAEAVLGFVTDAARPENAEMRDGIFGPVVKVPEEAPTFDRALGLAGRDPYWTLTQA